MDELLCLAGVAYSLSAAAVELDLRELGVPWGIGLLLASKLGLAGADGAGMSWAVTCTGAVPHFTDVWEVWEDTAWDTGSSFVAGAGVEVAGASTATGDC